MIQRRELLNAWARLSLPLFAGILVLTFGARTAAAAPIKVACIGEHTTHSDLYSNARETQPPGAQEYPLMLQALLGSGYDVRNFGDCCASVVQGYAPAETHPYVSGGNYTNSINFAPDIVVIGSWGRHDWGLSAKTAATVFTIAKFQTDYEDLVKRYIALASHPKIFCSLPIPILFGNDGPDNGYKTSPAADAIKAVAAKYNLPTIDLYSAFFGHMELFRQAPLKDAEGEHVADPAGFQKIADVVYAALKGNATGGNSDAGVGGSSSSGGAGSSSSSSSGGVGSSSSSSSGSSSSGSGGLGASSSGGVGGSSGIGGSSGGGSSGVGGSSSGAGSTSSSSSGVASGSGSSSSTNDGGGTGSGGATGSSSSGGSGTSTPPSAASGCACRTTPGGAGRMPWDGAAVAIVGWALMSRRKNRNRPQGS